MLVVRDELLGGEARQRRSPGRRPIPGEPVRRRRGRRRRQRSSRPAPAAPARASTSTAAESSGSGRPHHGDHRRTGARARLQQRRSVGRSLPSAGHDRRRSTTAPATRRAWCYALEHLGLAAPARRARRAESPVAERIILPGVGAARATLDSLARAGPRRARSARACTATASRSSASASGSRCCSTTARRATPTCLGWVPGTVRRFPDTGRVPQIGWNAVRFTRAAPRHRRARPTTGTATS